MKQDARTNVLAPVRGPLAALAVATTLSVGLLSDASLLSDVTGINIDLNREVGTGLSAMAGPAIGAFEDSGRRLIGETDAAMKRRIEQVDGVLGARLAEADQRLEQRLIQVDQIAADRLSQVEGIAQGTIHALDDTAKQRLAQADVMLKDRLADVDAIARSAIGEADGKLQERLQQMDEMMERSLGTADAIVAKHTIGVSAALRRLVLFGCLAIFIAAILWAIQTSFVRQVLAIRREEGGASIAELLRAWRRRNGRTFGLQVAAGGVVAVIGAALGVDLSHQMAKEAGALRTRYEGSFERNLLTLDLRESRYYAAQLRIIDPENGKYRAQVEKAELLRDVLTRPGLVGSSAGRGNLQMRLRRVSEAIGVDRDTRAIASHMLSQAGASRFERYLAALQACEAVGGEGEATYFAGLPLALMSLRGYLSSPMPKEVIEAELFARGRGRKPLNPRSEAELVASLRRGERLRTTAPHGVSADFEVLDGMVSKRRSEAVSRYLDMVSEHARANLGRRSEEAKAVVEQWMTLDAELLEGTPDGANLAALLTVDDATFARARAYSLRSALPETMPLIADLGDAKLRVLCAPPRVVWMKRVTGDLTRSTRNLLGREISESFLSAEAALRGFEEAARRRPSAGSQDAKASLARAAAVLGGCVGLPFEGMERALGLQPLEREAVLREPDVTKALRSLPGTCDAGVLDRARAAVDRT